MNDHRAAAEAFAEGKMSLADFLSEVLPDQTDEMPGVALDVDRQSRCGFPEVVYGEGKTPETLVEIARSMESRSTDFFATRITPDKADFVSKAFPQARYNSVARTLRINNANRAQMVQGRVPVVTAGTSDMPVAEEAKETLSWMGVDSEIVADIGVAGPQRLLAQLPKLRDCAAIVVVAGMEGALPSVVGGHVDCPVVGVPTSVGYGANFAGLSALLSMLNSCAANVTVVNIDAGFKAGYVAGLIAMKKNTMSG